MDVFDQVIDQRDRRLGTVTVDRLQTYETVWTTGVYAGKSVTIYGAGERVPCYFVGDPAWAAQHGFDGSQHDGWWGDVAFEEISDIRESVTDLLGGAAKPSIRDSLSLLIDFYRQASPAAYARFTPPAGERDFAAYRAAFGEDLPAGLAEVYAVIGRGPFLDTNLLSIEQVISARRMWDQIIAESDDPDDDYHAAIESLDPDAVSAMYWKPGWVQFTADGGGNGFAVDQTPEPGGTAGQVINVGSDEDYRQVLAESIADLLARIVELIRSGHVRFDDSGSPVVRKDDQDVPLQTALGG